MNSSKPTASTPLLSQTVPPVYTGSQLSRSSRSSTPSPTEPSLRTPPLSPTARRHLPFGTTSDTSPLAAADASVSGQFLAGAAGIHGVDMFGSGSRSGSKDGAAGPSSGRRASLRQTSVTGGGASGSQSGSTRYGEAAAGVQDAVAGFSDEDDALVMRDRDRDEGSVGRSGGVDVGVTRPKRRLSRSVNPSNLRTFRLVSGSQARASCGTGSQIPQSSKHPFTR